MRSGIADRISRILADPLALFGRREAGRLRPNVLQKPRQVVRGLVDPRRARASGPSRTKQVVRVLALRAAARPAPRIPARAGGRGRRASRCGPRSRRRSRRWRAPSAGAAAPPARASARCPSRRPSRPTPARRSARWSKYPSTRTTRSLRRIASRASEEAIEEPLLREDRRLGRVQVLRLALGREGASAESDRPAALVAHHEEEPVAEAVVRALGLRARLEQARLDQEGLGKSRGERFGRSSPTRRGRGRASAPARAPSGRRGPRGTSPPELPGLVEALRGRSARAAATASKSFSRRSSRGPRRSRRGIVTPKRAASASTASGNSSRSIWRTKWMTSPPAPQPKQWYSPLSRSTVKEGVRSLWKGQRPFQERPAFFRRVWSPMTSTMSAAIAELREDGVVDVEIGLAMTLGLAQFQDLSQFQDRRSVASFASGPPAAATRRAVLAQVVAQAVPQAAGAVAVDRRGGARRREERLVERALDGLDGLLEALADDVDFGRRSRETSAAGRLQAVDSGRRPRARGLRPARPAGSSSVRAHPHPLAARTRGAPSRRRTPRRGLGCRVRGRALARPATTSRERSSSASRASAMTASPRPRARPPRGRAPRRPAPAGAVSWRAASSSSATLRASSFARALESGEPLGEHPRPLLRRAFSARPRAARPRARPPRAPARAPPPRRAAARAPARRRSPRARAAARPRPRISLRPREDGLRDALLAGDGERAAAAGESRVEPVVRPAGRLVELHRGAERVGPRGREGLHGREVRRDERAAARLQVRLEERDGESAALLRVRRAPDLVDQGERPGPRVVQDRRRGSPSRRRRSNGRRGSPARRRSRSGSSGRSGARVPAVGRHGNAALGEQREEPRGLQHDGLSAGVGPRDDEEPACPPQARSRAARRRGPRAFPPRTRCRSFSKRASSRGWRAATIVQPPSSEISGSRAWPISPNAAFASRASSEASSAAAAVSELFVLEDRPAELPQEPLDLPALLRRKPGRGRCSTR